MTSGGLNTLIKIYTPGHLIVLSQLNTITLQDMSRASDVGEHVLTSAIGNKPCFRKMEAFHWAPRAVIAAEAPVLSRIRCVQKTVCKGKSNSLEDKSPNCKGEQSQSHSSSSFGCGTAMMHSGCVLCDCA